MNKILVSVSFVIFLCFSLVAAAPQTGVPPADDSRTDSPTWTVDDVVATEDAGGFRISPSGGWAVWVKSVADKEKNEHVSHLMLSSLTEKKEIQLTRGTDSSSNPKWAPDGQLIAFMTARRAPGAKPVPEESEDPKPQIWLINPFGGEPWPLTSSDRGVLNFEWADPETIIFFAQEDPTLYETAIKEKKDTSIVVDDEPHAPPARLFKLSIKSKKIMRLTDNTDRIRALALSPDGKKAVTVHDRSLRFVYDQKIRPVVVIHDLESGKHSQIFADRTYNISQVRWSADSTSFYASSEFTNHPDYVNATITELFHYDVQSGTIAKVNLDWPNGLAADIALTEDGFIALLANGARHRAARYRRVGQSWSREWIEGTHAQNIFGLELGKDGKTLLFAYSTASAPTQWFRASLGGNRIEAATQVTELNNHLKKKTIARTEVIRWKGALDEEVEGILFYPHNYKPGDRYPLVVMIHGGPAGADFDDWSDSWAYPHNLIAQRGAFVLKPNYHGSSNYGLKFVESISGGNYYDLEVPDIEKGVDSLIARGLVDPARLGAMGWSNGAILTTALVVNSTRYKAASAGAGNVEWASDWANAHFGASFDNYYLGKSPLEDPELYIRKSPFYRLDRVLTPTIIFFGTEDTNVPTSQGWMHYRALQQLGKTDVRFVLFPGEKHSPKKLVHQRRKLAEEVAWFDKHLFKTPAGEDEALKPDSPLAIALKLKSAKPDGRRYGTLFKGTLIPETVKHAGVEVGRFEVTRAQFAQFDPTYVIEPGKENLPANNISFEQARSYAEWLTRLTGETYRLPTEAESETLYASPSGSDNTLDYWAGYTVNPDDAVRLRRKLEDLGGAGSLLKEVGSFKGVGDEEMVFDLGGNVAEWIATKDGAGRVAGGSADSPSDTKLRARGPASEYMGFRVVKGLPSTSQ